MRDPKSCSKRYAALDILAAAAGPGRMGGAAQPSGPIVLALSGLWLGSRAPPCLSADCFMPIRLWHIPPILGLRYTFWYHHLVGVGATRVWRGADSIPGFKPRSLPDRLGPHCLPLGKGSPPSLSLQTPPLAVWVKLELWAWHLTSPPAASVSQSQALAPKV